MKKSFLESRWKTWRKIASTLCFLIMCAFVAVSQTRVSGTVTDAAGEPVIGANIIEKGVPANGTITDANGQFALTVKPGAILTASFIGFVAQDVTVGNQSMLRITLIENTKALDEVIVVGYSTQKKVNLSGSVSTISSKALANRPVTNANLALQGAAPNLNINMASGNPNSAPEINIRGYTSLNGGSAFILVDNVPVSSEELARINPSDIESVSVLKDAASAAIYGARAAFGVILITTKTAKSDKLDISVEGSYGLRQFYNMPDIPTSVYGFLYMQNTMQGDPNRWTQEQMEYGKRRDADPSLPELLYPSPYSHNLPDVGEDGWDYYSKTNWFDVALHDWASSYTGDVRVSQKTDRLSYAVSAGYYQENSIVRWQNAFKRYNMRGNATYAMTKWWKAGVNFSFSHTDYEASRMIGEEGGELFLHLATKYIIRPPFNPDGSYTQDGGATIIGGLRDGGRHKQTMNETQVSVNTQIDILENVWNVKADANFRFAGKHTNWWEIPLMHKGGPNAPLGGSAGPGTSYAANSSNLNNYSVYNLYTDFHKTFGDKHYVQALVGVNEEKLYVENNESNRERLITTSLPTPQLALGIMNVKQSIEELALIGLFARVNYIFDNKYILEFNGRRDGTSRFQDHWGFFPSASAAWVASQEKFFGNINKALKISYLKLRGSYGVLGNQVVKSGNKEVYYPFISTMSSGNIGWNIDNTRPFAIYMPGSVSAGNLTWETVRTVNGGFDISLFDGRFDLSADIYTRYTENMLTKAKTLPALFGVSEPRINGADLKTKGWDISVGFRDRICNINGAPLSLGLRFMIADNRTWITRYDNPTKLLSDYYVGQEIGEIWGYETLGYFASDEEAASWADQSALGNGANNYRFYAGDLKFADLNGDGKIDQGKNTVDDPGDRKIIGNNRHRLPYSFTIDGEWNGFDLRVFLQGEGKRDAYPAGWPAGIYFWGMYATPWCSPNAINYDHWTPETPNAYLPRLKQEIGNNGELSKPQTRYLQDASFLRVKNITLGYTLPQTLTNKWNINRLRFYLTAENAFTFHHIKVAGNDPEKAPDSSSSFYPFQRIISLGANINF